MKIVKPSAKLDWITPNPLEVIERAGRTAYKSEWKIAPGSAEMFVRMIMKRGHLSVIEHASAAFRFICDRGVSHEIVRHRLASYTQESTRFCRYSKERFGKEISVIAPSHPTPLEPRSYSIWLDAMVDAQDAYFKMLDAGQPAQIARSVLPTCLKTEIVTTANLREWTHIFRMRLSKAAHPQIRYIMALACRDLINRCRPIFESYEGPAKEILEKYEQVKDE